MPIFCFQANDSYLSTVEYDFHDDSLCEILVFSILSSTIQWLENSISKLIDIEYRKSSPEKMNHE